MPTDKSSNQSTRSSWTYTQTDVDTLREQIEQNEAGKRRWLLLLLLITAAALVGAIILLSTSYALYSSSESEKTALATENAALKSQIGKCEKDLNAYIEKEKKQNDAVAKAQESIDKMLPGALGGANVSSFARLVYESPSSRVEMDKIPPSNLFRNWKTQNDNGNTDVYTLVGGNVKGKWVIYSNLISRQ
jgi:outer membrane murein-binding lipoprotein Lpp